MPFIVPKKRRSYTKKNHFSRYRDIEVSPNGLLLLQQRKKKKEDEKPKEPKKSKKPKKEKIRKPNPEFRIITNLYPRYEVAYGTNLEEFKSYEWNYCITTLPTLMPKEFESPKAQHRWLINHFLALIKGDGNASRFDPEEDKDGERVFSESEGSQVSSPASSRGASPTRRGFNKSSGSDTEKSAASPQNAKLSDDGSHIEQIDGKLGGRPLPPAPNRQSRHRRTRSNAPPKPKAPPPGAISRTRTSHPDLLIHQSKSQKKSLTSSPQQNGLSDPEETKVVSQGSSRRGSDVASIRSLESDESAVEEYAESKDIVAQASETAQLLDRQTADKNAGLNSVTSPHPVAPRPSPATSSKTARGFGFAPAQFQPPLVAAPLDEDFTDVPEWARPALPRVPKYSTLSGAAVSIFLAVFVHASMVMMRWFSAETAAWYLGCVDMVLVTSLWFLWTHDVKMAFVPAGAPTPAPPSKLAVAVPRAGAAARAQRIPQLPRAISHRATPGRIMSAGPKTLPIAVSRAPSVNSSVTKVSINAPLVSQADVPISGSDLPDEIEESVSMSEQDPVSGKILPGATVYNRATEGQLAVPNTWYPADATTFMVRCGPDYSRNKKKALSAEALYEVISLDFFSSARKLETLSDYIEYPTIDNPAGICPRSDWDLEENDLGIPPLLIINGAFPAYAPPNPLWGAKREDGPNWSLLIICRLTEAGKKAIKAKSHVAKLFKHFLDNLDDPSINNRFKCIPRMSEHSPTPLNSLMARYNGKPFLTRPQHKFFRTKDYLEAFIDVHTFTYIARKGFNSFVHERFSKVVLDCGFVVEARENEELPEQMLCAFSVSSIDLDRAYPLDEFIPALE